MFCFIKCIIIRKKLHKGTELMYKKLRSWQSVMVQDYKHVMSDCFINLCPFFCFVACYRRGLWFSETTWLCSAFTQRPSYPSKRCVLRPQPRRNLRLTPHCVGEQYLSSRVGLKDSKRLKCSWARKRDKVWRTSRVLASVLHLSRSASSSNLLGLRMKLMSKSIFQTNI